MSQRIFISSVQREFAKERKALAEYVRKDAILGRFFDVFLFEEVPAQERKADGVYLSEVDACDIYLGIFGHTYGNVDSSGVSATEREYLRAAKRHKTRICFVDKSAGDTEPRQASVQVMLFRDRLEVWSPGGLPRGMTIGKLFAAHKSVPVNPLLARAMYLKGYIEKSGTGTGDMIAKCASWGVPAPEWYEDDPDDFRVVLKRPVPEVGAEKMEQESRVKSSEKTRVKSRGVNYKKASGNKGERTQCEKRGGVKSRVKIMSSAERIIAYLMANPEASAHELSIVVNLSVKGVEKNLRTLKASNRLRRVGPDKGGHWEVIG